jgi:TolB-like protein/nucleoside phosphorylase
MLSAVVLTTSSEEYLAVRKFLTHLQEEVHEQGTIYERGTFVGNGVSWNVGIAEVEGGNAEAGIETERAIRHFEPNVLLSVGIAEGIEDCVKIGDVVVATKVYGYESGKVGDEKILTRPAVWNSAYALIQRAKQEAKKDDWLKRGKIFGNPQVFVGAIAAGEKVAGSKTSEVFRFLQSNYNDVIAIEMGSYGFLSAAFAYPNIQAIVVRGISDLVKDQNDDVMTEVNIDRHREASANASSFAFEVLSKIQHEEKIFSPSSSNVGIESSKQLKVQVVIPENETVSTNSSFLKVIAILPFKYNKKGRLDNTLADGFWDGIIRRLSRLSGLRIISTESTQSLSESELPLTEIGHQLQAHFVISGSIREFDNSRLGLTIKLIEVSSSAVDWIHNDDYEFGYNELAVAQRDVIRSIADELAIHLTSIDKGILERGILINPTAYEYYVRASGLCATNNQQDLEDALSLLDNVINLDSNFADAYALKGYTLWRKYFSGWSADINSLNESINFTQEALKLNPLSVTATMSLIRIYWDLGRSEEALEQGMKVLTLAPESNEALIAMARAYNNAGMADYSIPLIEKVLNIDPTHPTAMKLLIWNYVMTEKYLEADQMSERYFRQSHKDANTSWAVVMTHIQLKDYKRAIEVAQMAL